MISPLHIHERTAGIAAVNRRIMADPAHQRADVFAVQPQLPPAAKEARHDHLCVADDAQRDRLRERHRTAHRQNVIANSQQRRITERGRRELALRGGLQLDYGNVGQGIGADQFGFDFLAVPEGAKHPRRVPGDVVICDDVTVLGDDRAAADLLHFDFAAIAIFGGNDTDAHERLPDLADGGIHLRPHAGGHGTFRRKGRSGFEK